LIQRNQALLLRLQLGELLQLCLLDLLCLPLLQEKQVLSRSDLSCNVAHSLLLVAIGTTWSGSDLKTTLCPMATHHLTIDYGGRILAIVEILHVLVHVVFLADFLAQGYSHFVTPVVAQFTMSVFVGSEYFVDRASLFTRVEKDGNSVREKKKKKNTNNDTASE